MFGKFVLVTVGKNAREFNPLGLFKWISVKTPIACAKEFRALRPDRALLKMSFLEWLVVNKIIEEVPYEEINFDELDRDSGGALYG